MATDAAPGVVLHYESVSDDWYASEQELRLRKTLDVLAAERARGPLIEFGALSGAFAVRCAERLNIPRAEITCSDFTPVKLAIATNRGFRTSRWNLVEEPRPDELAPRSFQTLLLCEILEHLVAPDETLRTLVELLAPGGLLLATTPNLASLPNRVRLALGKTPSFAPAPGLHVMEAGSLAAPDHLRVCVPGEWQALVESVGLTVTRLEGCTYGPAKAQTLRRRLTLGLSRLLERAPGRLWMGTMIVARKA